MLVLFSQGVVRWLNDSSTAYIAHLRAPVVATQPGARDFLLTESVLSGDLVGRMALLPGVASATPVLAISGALSSTRHPLPILMVGYPTGAGGGPWQLASGRLPSSPDETVLDQGLARINRLPLGSSVPVLGRQMRVVGLSLDTNAAGIFFVFVPLSTAQAMVGANVVSDVLLTPRPGVTPSAVGDEVDRLGGVNTVPTGRLLANDRNMVQAGFAQPTEVFVLVCLLVGLLIASMILYTTTVEHARDFALLKALGSRPALIALVVVSQSFLLAISGFLVGWGLAAGLVTTLRHFEPVLDARLTPAVLAEVFGFLVVANLVAMVLPIRFLRRVETQEVFKA
jgi:putative ABC transport system permease protein